MVKAPLSVLRLIAAGQPPITSAIARSRLVVYVVENDDAVRDSIRALLESCGYFVVCCPRATDFLAGLAGTERGSLVLEHHLPDSSGYDVLAKMRNRGVFLSTIMTTDALDPTVKDRAIEAGAHTLLIKPWTADDLIRALELAQQVDRSLVH